MNTKIVLERWTIILSFIFTLTINDQTNYIFIPIKHDSPWSCCFRGATLYYPMHWCFTPMPNKTYKNADSTFTPNFRVSYNLMIGNMNHRKIMYFIELIEMSAIQKHLWLTMWSVWNNEDFLRYNVSELIALSPIYVTQLLIFRLLKSYLFVSKIQKISLPCFHLFMIGGFLRLSFWSWPEILFEARCLWWFFFRFTLALFLFLFIWLDLSLFLRWCLTDLLCLSASGCWTLASLSKWFILCWAYKTNMWRKWSVIAIAFCSIAKSLILWRVVSEAIWMHLTGSDTIFLLCTIRLLMSTLGDPRAFKLIWIASMILFDFPIANLHWRPFRCLNINLPRSDWVWSTKSDHTSSTAMASRWKRLYADINTLSEPLS